MPPKGKSRFESGRAARRPSTPPVAEQSGSLPDRALTTKHQRFIAEYLRDHNATKAAERAGYSAKTAYAQGSRLLKDAEIKAAIQKSVGRALERAELSAARVLEELRRMAFGDRVALMRAKTVAELEALPDELRALVTDFEIFDANIPGVKDGRTDRVRRYKTVGKTAAVEMLAKHFKLLTDVVEHEASEKLLAQLDRGRERNRLRKGRDG